MGKRLLFLTIILFFAQLSGAFSQLTGVTVDPGPYTPGSSIAATFSIGSTCIRPGNVFNLYLVRPDGTEIPTRIGTFNGFYSTFVNGIIPPGTPAAPGYMLRIKSTTPILISSDSAPFDIVTGTAVTAGVNSFPELAFDAAGKAEVFGYCPGRDMQEFIFSNASTANSTVTGVIKNEITPLSGPTNFSFASSPPDPSFMARLGHYTAVVTARLNGTVGTRAYLIVNNNINNSFGTTGSNIVCLPGGFLQYTVDLSDAGIKNNFPGTTYEIRWGDGTGIPEVFTICDLATGFVRHEYTRSSCGQPVYNTGNGNQFNVFGINISAVSPFCPGAGAGLSTFVRVVDRPENRFTSPITACTGSFVNFTNTSIAGQTETNTSACTDNNIRYNWFVDNVRVAQNQPRSYTLSHQFTSPGMHEVRLESVITGQCNGAPAIRQICIQDPPRPAFDFGGASQTGCAPFTIQAFDRSFVDERCNTDNTYNWIVTGPQGVVIRNQGDKNPTFEFTNPGTYEVILEIQTASCGPVRTIIPQRIILADGAPVTDLSIDATLCGLGTFDFNATTTGPTRTTLTGTQQTVPNVTYTWYITESDGTPLPTTDYSFEGGTHLHSQYPTIKFNTYKTYKVRVVHVNSCGQTEDSQRITFLESPVPTIALSANPICYNASVNLFGSSSNTNYNSYTWTRSGDGTFANANTLTPTYTPGPNDRNLGTVTLTLTLNTGLTGNCAFVPVSTILNIYPNNTGTNTAIQICTGDRATRNLTSSVSGSSFTWSATNPDGNATGFTATGSGATIDDLLTNNSLTTDAVVIYTVTPSSTSCTGVPYTFTVRVTPRPILTATPSNPVICSNSGSSINLSSNLGNSNTTYKWSSAAPTSITGNTNPATPSTVTLINDLLVNNGTTRGTVTYTITPYSSAGCAGTPVTVTIDVDPAVTPANAGADATICEISTYDLKGNSPSVGTGLWTIQSSHPITPTIGDATAYETRVSGLVAGQVYTFRWTITGAGVCANSSDDVVITVTPRPVLTAPVTDKTICHNNPAAIVINSDIPSQFIWTSSATAGISGNTNPSAISATGNAITINDVLLNSTFSQGTVTYTIKSFSPGNCEGNTVIIVVKVDPAVTPANAGTDITICSTSTYVLDGNRPDVGTGLWKVVSASSGTPTFADATDPKTTVSGLNPGATYIFEWEITGTGQCPGNSDNVTVIVNMPTVPGTTSGAQTVCQNNNSGTITLTGFTGSVTAWQSLPEGQTVWTDLPGVNTSPSYTFNNISVTTQYRAVVKNAGCTIEYSTPTIITVAPATTTATVGADQTLCNLSIATLTGNTPALGETGIWTRLSGPVNAQITDLSSPTTTVTNLDPGQTYVFRWTITGNSPCGPTFADQTIRNNAPINQSISNPSLVVCNGASVTIDGSTPTGGDQNGNYIYTWETNTAGGPWTAIIGQTGEDLTLILSTTGQIGFRRIVTSGGCTLTSNELIFTVQPPISGNNIAADQIICSGTVPNAITGIGTLTGGDGSFLYQWQSSPDGTTWSNIVGAQNPDFAPLALTATIYYRRLVGTTACAGALQSISNSVKITVNPNAKSEYTWTADSGCAPFALQISAVTYPDRNGTYTWFANGVQIGTTNTTGSFPGYTLQNSNERVTIRLVVTSSFGCSSDLFEHDFTTNQAVPAIFTPTATTGCGPLTVNFVNGSDLNAGATFRWNFGNGQTSNATNPPQITFQPDASGKDTTYTVTLYSITSCGIDSAKGTVLVKSPPRPVFSPSTTNGCSPLIVNFSNNSPLQTGITYTFNFGDGTPPTTTTDRSSVSHTYRTTTNTQTFNATMSATNQCGTVTTTPYQIVVRPNTVVAELVVNGTQLSGGCAPYTVTFDNNSTGATNFSVDFGDGTPPRQSIISPERFTHTFNTAGTFTVTLTATNGCSTSTTTETITVLPQPAIDFTADNTLGCTGLAVKFRNTVQNGLSYVWDFGDGSPTSTEVEPTHIYNGDQEYYTVTLTATNNLGCPTTVIKNQFIHIVQPPVAAFNVSPSTIINIPDYSFRFQDESTNNPTIWQWDFGDGTSSTQRNPSHTYLDTGTYRVTLKTINQQGCFTTTFKDVTIKGVPGYLFVPNSFIPGSTQPELRLFRAKGSGIQTWRFSIFNKWGQLLWETTNLDEGRPADGWDGTFKGQPMPQGVYYWKIDVQMVNGSEWKGMTYDKSPAKRTGPIHLIR
jgi:PKD repeat protein